MTKRRSWLFVPAINKKFFDKLEQLNCDVVIFDLEDSVLDDCKDEARKNLNELDFKKLKDKEIAIRINSVRSPFFKKECKLVNEKDPDFLVLPKVRDEDDIKILEKKIEPEIQFVPIIETIKGYYNREKILTASSRIKTFAFGAEDFSADTEINKGELQKNPLLVNVICDLLLIAKEKNLWFIDCVFTGYETEDHLQKLKKEALFTRRLGAEGKLVIHPSQIDIVNEVYSITQQEIEEAEAFIQKFNSLKDGCAVVATDYYMQDIPSYKKYSKLLKKAEELGYK